jgi:hypothetical protein
VKASFMGVRGGLEKNTGGKGDYFDKPKFEKLSK